MYSITRRQDAPKVYDINANIYIYDAEWLRNPDNKSPVTDNTEIYVMPQYAAIDIDTQNDFELAEFNFKKYYS